VRLACGLGLLVALGLAAPAVAAEDAPWRFDVYNELMSPYCPGRTLNDCPSGQAEELREWIAAQEDAGRPRGEVVDQLYRLYGDGMRSAPRVQGWGLAAYLIPVVGTLVVGGVIALFLRRQTAAPVEAALAAPEPLDPELERLVDEELRGERP
jgi:cytochrome c-type biogenesis protein CcmH/NrfF